MGGHEGGRRRGPADPEKVLAIFAERRGGKKMQKIADEHGMTRSNVEQLLRRHEEWEKQERTKGAGDEKEGEGTAEGTAEGTP